MYVDLNEILKRIVDAEKLHRQYPDCVPDGIMEVR